MLFFFLGGSFCLKSQEATDTIIELKEVQVQANRIFQKETAGMKETQVDSLIIKQKLNLTLSELLSENTPVHIKSHGRGALATASFRGTGSSHTQVNWNGININSPMLGMVDFSLIPVYIIDDITLRHGSASVADQSGGLGGSINITNRADWSNTRQVSYMQGVGSFSTWDQFLLLGLGNSRIQWRSRLYYNHSANDYTFVNRTIANIENEQITHPVDTNRHAAFSRYGTLQELYWQPSSSQIFSLKWWGQWAERGIPRVISFEGAENANISKQYDQDHKGVAQWQWYGKTDKLTLRSGYASRQLDFSLTNQVSGIEPVAAVYSESTQHSFLQHAGYRKQLSPRFTFESTINFDHHRVQTHDSVSRTGFDTAREDASLLLALRSQAHQRVLLNLMIRQEYTGNRLSPIIPFLGIDYLLKQEQPWVLKASIARNYRHPSLNDLYWVPGGNPDLRPEEGFSLEAGTENILHFGWVSLQSEFTFFRSDINDWILWVPSIKGYWEPRNIRRVLSSGLETHLKLSGDAGLLKYRIMGTYTYTRAINYGDPLIWGDESYGKQLVFIPVHSGNLLFNVQFREISLTWQHNSFGERFTTSSNELNQRNWLYPYYMNDLSLSKQWNFSNWGMQTELRVNNLFNETYHTILYRPMPGRNYMLSVMVGLR